MQSLSSSTEIGSSWSCLYKVSLLKTCFFLIGCPSPGWCWQNQVLVGTPASLALQKQIYWLPKELSFTAEKKSQHTEGIPGFLRHRDTSLTSYSSVSRVENNKNLQRSTSGHNHVTFLKKNCLNSVWEHFSCLRFSLGWYWPAFLPGFVRQGR